MHRGAGVFGSIHFGFDAQRLFLRLDPARHVVALCDHVDGLEILLLAGDSTFPIRGTIERGDIRLHLHGRGMGRGKMRAIVEVAVPFAALGLQAGRRVGIAVRGMRGDVEVDRIPARGWLFFEVPDESFESVLWKV